jgi:hypothetical protein
MRVALYGRRRGSVQACVRSGGAGVGSRRARTRSVLRPIGGGRAAGRTRCLCVRCGGGYRACSAMTQVVVVVAPAGRQLRRTSPSWSATRADGRDTAHERFQALAVMRYRARDPQRQRQSVRSVTRWICDPSLPRSVGFDPVRSPLCRPRTHRVDGTTRPVEHHHEKRRLRSIQAQVPAEGCSCSAGRGLFLLGRPRGRQTSNPYLAADPKCLPPA